MSRRLAGKNSNYKVCVMSIIQIDAIFKIVKERPRRYDLGPGKQRGRGNHKSCSSRWEITNTNLTLEWALTLCTYFALTLPFKPSIKSLSIAHSTDNFKHEQQKGLCVCVYMCALLRSFICPRPNASLTYLIDRNLATRTPMSLYTLTLTYKWPIAWLTKLSPFFRWPTLPVPSPTTRRVWS